MSKTLRILLCLAVIAASIGVGFAAGRLTAPQLQKKAVSLQVSGMELTTSTIPTLAPVLYKFFDYSDQSTYGAVQYYMWDEINPARGVYDWSELDRHVDAQSRLLTTLSTGEVISKPVIIMLIGYISEHSNWTAATFYDATPTWALQAAGITTNIGGRLVGHVLTSGNAKAVVPAYDSEVVRSAYLQMIAALGEHLRGRSNIAMIVTTGIDGETQPTKDWGVAWDTQILDAQAPGVRYRFSQFVNQVMDAYRAAFPNNVLLINNAPGGAGVRASTSAYAAKLGIGLHNSSLWTDRDSATGTGAGAPGLWDTMATYSMTVHTMWESVNGMTNAEQTYWTLIAGLSFHPTAMDLHPEFFTSSPAGFLPWVTRYLGRTVGNAPDVWCVMRDAEYPKQSWDKGAVSGWQGNWNYWLTATGGTVVKRADMPAAAQASIYSRQARRLSNESMTLSVDAGYKAGPYRVYVTAFGAGTLSIGGSTCTLTGQEWQTVELDAQGREFVLSATGTAYVHMVRVEDQSMLQATASMVATASTPSPTPSTTPMPTKATATSTPSACPSATPVPMTATTVATATIPTATPTMKPTEPTPTPSATRRYCCCCCCRCCE